ncbi:MAG: hypothetical protein ACRD18_07670 [Terriglobia bacterium]
MPSIEVPDINPTAQRVELLFMTNPVGLPWGERRSLYKTWPPFVPGRSAILDSLVPCRAPTKDGATYLF